MTDPIQRDLPPLGPFIKLCDDSLVQSSLCRQLADKRLPSVRKAQARPSLQACAATFPLPSEEPEPREKFNRPSYGFFLLAAGAGWLAGFPSALAAARSWLTSRSILWRTVQPDFRTTGSGKSMHQLNTKKVCANHKPGCDCVAVVAD